MNVLLIDPPFYTFQNLKGMSASYGLASIAAILNQNGHHAKIFSPDLESPHKKRTEGIVSPISNYNQTLSKVLQRITEIIYLFPPSLIGIHLTTCKSQSGYAIAEFIKKKHPAITVVAGGSHASALSQEVLETGFFDFVVYGEGEKAMLQLTSTIEKSQEKEDFQNIDNLAYKNEDGELVITPANYSEDLDSLPFPNNKAFINFESFPKEAFNSILTSRGCPYHCSFCASRVTWGNRPRYHSPQYISDYITKLKNEFGLSFFRFNDDTFTLNKNYLQELLPLLQNLDIKWHCDTRADYLSPELIDQMIEAGLTMISIGVETSSDELLHRNKKMVSLEEISQTINQLKSKGVRVICLLIVGLPGETFQQARETFNFAKKASPHEVCVSTFTPHPGTELFTLPPVEEKHPYKHHYHHSGHNFASGMTDRQWKTILRKYKRLQNILWFRSKIARVTQKILKAFFLNT